jgi:hypothetical protein
MGNANLFMEDTDFNICKSWLCNSTDGETYILSDWFGRKLHPCPVNVLHSEYEDILDGCFSSEEWEYSIGYFHDFKVDSEITDIEAEKLANRLNAYVNTLNAKIDALKKISPGEMKNIKALEKNSEIKHIIRSLLAYSVAGCYMENIVNNIKDDVIEDINESTDSEEWSSDDVRLAIGRVLSKRLNIEI